MRVLSIFVGILLVFSSVWCFAHPGATFLSLAFLVGFIMLIHGLTALFDYFSMKKNILKGEAWLLADGIITVILSILVLFNQLVADAAIPVFFGMWIMFSGVVRIANGLNIEKGKGWIWKLSLGILCVLAGIYAFLNSIVGNFGAAALVGMTFILQGINMIFLGSAAEGKRKRLHR